MTSKAVRAMGPAATLTCPPATSHASLPALLSGPVLGQTSRRSRVSCPHTLVSAAKPLPWCPLCAGPTRPLAWLGEKAAEPPKRAQGSLLPPMSLWSVPARGVFQSQLGPNSQGQDGTFDFCS